MGSQKDWKTENKQRKKGKALRRSEMVNKFITLDALHC